MHRIETKRLLLSKTVPALSETALKLMGLAGDMDVSVARVAATIGADKTFADRLLLIANSPLFRPVSPIRDVHSAVVRLGVANTIELATSLAVLRATGGKMPAPAASIRRSSLSIGAIGRALRHEYESQTKPGNSFLSGVVGDVGMVTLMRNQWLTLGVEGLIGHRDSVCDQERATIGFSHVDLATDVLRKWRIGDDVLALVAEHHDREPTRSDPVSHELLRVATCIERGLAEGKDTDQILEDTEREERCDSVPPSRLATLWPRILEVRAELGALAN